MAIRTYYAALVSAALLSGCATPQLRTIDDSVPIGEHRLMQPYSSAEPNGLFHLSCTDKYPDGVSVFAGYYRDKAEFGRIDLARRYFAFAAMANNSYRSADNPRFAIPGWTLVSAHESGSNSGLAAEIYREDVADGGAARLVVAFRGTESHDLHDWLANFSLVEPRQFREAIGLVEETKAANPSSKVVVTGHSLGGAIALNLSMRFSNLDAVAFNASPRAFFKDTKDYDNVRVHIYERGEVLSLASGPYLRLRLPNSTHYGNYNFLDYKLLPFSPVPEHGIYELTRALTLVAISSGDHNAYRFFRANIPKDVAIKKDPKHCAYLYADATES